MKRRSSAIIQQPTAVDINLRILIANIAIANMGKQPSIFGERYRVVAIEGDCLVIRGILSGDVLTIVNPEPETPLRLEDYPPGKLIALTDPSQVLPN